MRPLHITALLVLLADQISKLVVVEWLNLKVLGEIEVLSPYLDFRMAWNTGINFGILQTSRWVLIAVALAIIIWVYLWVRKEGARPIGMVSAGVLIGGALGNVVDRIRYGAVADFLNVSCCGFENPYSFNIADISIFVGAFGLILFTGEKKTP
ncbi:MAG: signal peptidase II [Halocynthiibacter sp.]